MKNKRKLLDLKNYSWKKTKTNFFIENKNVELNEKNRFYYKDNIIINKLNELLCVDFNNNKILQKEKYFFYNEDFKIVSDWEFFIYTIIVKKETYLHLPFVISYFDIRNFFIFNIANRN